MADTSIFERRHVAAAVRTDEDFNASLQSSVDVIFLLSSTILTVKDYIDKAHEAGKYIIIHMDFAEGIGKDRAGLGYLKSIGADGIATTRTNLIRPAKDLGLITVQRFFVLDSHSVDTAMESIRIARPDIVEIMPGVVVKKIVEFAQRLDTPIFVGGLIEFKAEVDAAISAGATAVSTAKRDLWDYR